MKGRSVQGPKSKRMRSALYYRAPAMPKLQWGRASILNPDLDMCKWLILAVIGTVCSYLEEKIKFAAVPQKERKIRPDLT